MLLLWEISCFISLIKGTITNTSSSISSNYSLSSMSSNIDNDASIEFLSFSGLQCLLFWQILLFLSTTVGAVVVGHCCCCNGMSIKRLCVHIGCRCRYNWLLLILLILDFIEKLMQVFEYFRSLKVFDLERPVQIVHYLLTLCQKCLPHLH